MHELTREQHASYLRQLLQRIDMLSLPLGSGLNFSLVQVFQPLRLRQSSRDVQETLAREEESSPADDEEQDEHVEPLPPQQVLADNGLDALSQSPQGRLVILGSPGSGKTTVLKHLAYHHIRLALENPDAAQPLFLSLPDLARSGQDLSAYLAQQAADLGLERDAGQAFVQAIEQGHAFICLDSLDEVLPRQRAGIIRQINALAHHPGNIWIIGSRFTDYKGGQFEPGRFQEWELLPLDTSRQLHLAAHLLPTLQRQLSPHASETHSLDPGTYVRALEEHRQAANWGENPLLFSLAAVVYLRQGTLSGSRSRLYREVIDAVLETRQPDPHLRTHLRALLAEVALDLYQRKGRTFHASDLRASLSTINSQQHATWSIESSFTALLNSGVLDGVSFETYSFRHQTFQEYLVAAALASRFMSDDEQVRAAGEQFTWSKHTYSRWHEIQRLLAGILVQEYGAAGVVRARAWLERLLRQRESPEGDPGNLSLELALKLLGEMAGLEDWPGAEMLALEEMAAAMWSQEVLKQLEAFRDKQRYQSMAVEIGLLSPPAQRRALETLMRAYIEGGKQELATIIGAIRSHETTRYLLELLARFSNSHQRRRVKQLLGYLGEFAPIARLLEELRSDKDDESHMASLALTQLAPLVPAEHIVPVLLLKGFGRPAAAKNILKAIARTRPLPIQDLLPLLESKDREVAAHIAEVLAAVHHPTAITFLLAYLDNPDRELRLTAMRALRSSHIVLPLDHILPLLNKKDADVRRVAVEMLAHFRSERTLEVLHRAASDLNTEVRLTALKILGTWHDPASRKILIQMTGEADSSLVKEALAALGAYGMDAPLELLLGFLQKPLFVYPVLDILSQKPLCKQVPLQPLLDLCERDWSLRDVILYTLGKMGHQVDASLLLQTLNDTYQSGDLTVVQALGRSLSSSHLAELIERAAEQCWVAYSRAIVLLECLPEGCPSNVLLTALRDERWQVSDAAVLALCKRAGDVAQADLLPLLTHSHARIRQNALQVLIAHPDRPSLAVLLASLHDHHPDVRAVAAQALARYPNEAPLDELYAATRDESSQVRREAAASLGKLGKRDLELAVAGILNLFEGEHASYEEADIASVAFAELGPVLPAHLLLPALFKSGIGAYQAALALGQMGEQAPVEELVLALRHQDDEVRRMAVVALARMGKHAPLPSLLAALRAKNAPSVRREVMKALATLSIYGNIPDEVFLQQVFNKRDHATYQPLFQAFNAQKKRLPEAIVVEALEHCQSRDAGEVLHYLCQFPEWLPAFPEKQVATALSFYAIHLHRFEKADVAGSISRLLPLLSSPALLETLTHQSSEARIGALLLLTDYPGSCDLDPIMDALHDPDSQVRRQAIICLQKRSAEDVSLPAIRACLQDANPAVCKTALEALASLGSRAPLAEIMALLDAPASEVRGAAVMALRELGLFEQVSIEIFVNALEDKDIEEYPDILQAICNKDPRSAIEYCSMALGSSNEELAVAAFRMLQQICPELVPEIVQEATGLFEGHAPGRFLRSLSMGFIADISKAAGSASPEVIERLDEMLDWPYWEIRMKTARALGTLRRNIPDDTIRRLLELRRDPRSRAVREAADEALAEILSLETGIEDD